MIAVSHKAKHYLLATVKVLVLVITFGYIFYKLKNNPALDLGAFMASVYSRGTISVYAFILLFIFASANWFFEILKWQTLVSYIEKIDFKTAIKQSLASLTVSLATPSRIGEYGAKALFFEKQKRKQILLINFFSSGLQMLVTTLFGVFGLFYFPQNFNLKYSIYNIGYFGIGVVLLFAVGYYFRKKELLLKGFSILKTFAFFKNIPFHIKFKAVLFSIFRYIIFSGMFYALLLFFGASITFNTAILLIFAMYFLVSILPSLFIFDVVIRGGVAVWLFSFVGVDELIILSTVLAMWVFNFVLPSVVGSFYVLTYQPATR